jgi:serine/threonine-protein kinase
MAPEQAMGTGVDHRADLYALGVMLFEMVTGARPFDAENVVSLVTMHIVEPPPTLAERLPPGTPLPEGLEALVAALLEKDRERRIQSARDLAEQSRRILGISSPPSQAVPSGSWNNGAPASGAVPSGYTSTGVLGSAPTSAGVVSSGAPAVASAATSIESSPAAHNLPIGYVPTAQIAPGEPRWRSELQAAIPELERLRARLPGPLSRLPLVAFPAAFGAFLLLIIAVLAWPRSSTETATPGATSSEPPPSGLTEAQLRAAQSSGIPALETLAERFPGDLRVQRALLKAYHEAKRPGDAVKILARLAETQKNLLSEELVLEIVKSAVAGPSEASEAMFTLLETGFGAEGVEVLYALWTDKKDVGEKTRGRAGKSLAKPEVKELAMKPTRVLIDLRTANAGCESKRAAVALALEVGDARAVPLMQPLTSTKGCSILGRFDCWPCLRNGNLLNNAIKAAEKRPAP